LIGGDGYNNKWDGVVIGNNVPQRRSSNPQVFIESYIHHSDTNPEEQLINNCHTQGVRCNTISYSDGATITVDVSRSTYAYGENN